MTVTPSVIDALDEMVEKTYAAGILAPYDAQLFQAVLALSSIGYQHQDRMIEIAAGMLNSLTDVDRQAVMERFAVPGSVQRLIGSVVTWPEPRLLDSDISELTPEDETAYRRQLEMAINHHAEKEAARIITTGTRKQHSYREKMSSAKELLAKDNPAAELPEDWPYLDAEVQAGFETDIVAAANSILATAENWKAIDAQIEKITRIGVRKVRNDPIEEIESVMRDTNDRVTRLIERAVAS